MRARPSIFRLIEIAAVMPLLGAMSANAQQVTFENVLFKGDPLPNGLPFLNAGWVSLEGDTIVFEAVDASQFSHWICTMDLKSRAITIHAGPTTPSPTYPGKNFKAFLSPTIGGGKVAFSARAESLSNMEGIYTPIAGGGVATIVDQLHPAVNFPVLAMTDGTSVLFRDGGYADERIGHATFAGGFQGWLATDGSPAPGGGTFFRFERPFIANGLGVFEARFNFGTGSLLGIFSWNRDTGVMSRIAMEGDPFPGHPEPLKAVTTPGTDGVNIAFLGYAGPFPWTSGLFLWDGTSVKTIAHSKTVLPGGKLLGEFATSGVPIDDGNLTFVSHNPAEGLLGAYAYYQGSLIKLIDNSEPIGGKPMYSISMRDQAMDANRVAFIMQLEDCCSNGGIYVATIESECYADCDGSGSLDFFDFLCFQNEFAAGATYADCDGSGSLDFFDFLCFQNKFAAGCQ